MTGHAVRAVLVVAFLLASVSGGYATPDAPAQSGLGSETFAQSAVDPDSTVLDVTLAKNGSATWQVSYRVELVTQNETEAFKQLRADIQANTSTYLSAFRNRMERTARTAENATGRQMAIEDLSVSTSVEGVQQYGTVTYTFRWTNFSAVDGQTIRTGDALAGFFLEENTRLSVTWPRGYEATTVSPEPDERRDRTVTWIGPIEFGSDGPRIVASPASSGPNSSLILAAVLVIAVAVALAALWLRKREKLPWGGETAEAGSTERTPEPEPEPESEPAPDGELLSNEERVLRLLDERGGRVKQQEVATEFDWTDAKTSQVVKALREDDEIDVFRLGRENVLVLPEESDL